MAAPGIQQGWRQVDFCTINTSLAFLKYVLGKYILFLICYLNVIYTFNNLTAYFVSGLPAEVTFQFYVFTYKIWLYFILHF